MMKENTLMKEVAVLLSSPTMRAVPDVVALYMAGYDVTFATSVCFSDLSWLPDWRMTKRIKDKMSVRLFAELSQVEVKRIWHPELAAIGLWKFGLASKSQRHKVLGEMFDRSVRRKVGNYDIFHFVNGVGYLSAKEAKKHGTVVVLSQRAAHLDQEVELLEAEYERWGQHYVHPEEAFRDRVYGEHQLADAIIVQSDYSKQSMVKHGVEPEKVWVVNYTFNVNRFKPSLNEKIDASFRVLFVGSVNIHKGVQYLIEAFLKAELPEAELILVGSVSPAIEELVSKSNSEQIKIIGPVPNHKLHTFYSEASVLVLPSLTDAWGFVVLEAMASGLPVIVTENTGAKDAVRPGIDGFVVPIRDSDAIAEALTKLSEDRDLCETMGRNAARQIQENFTWEKYMDRLLTVYRKFH